jgi:ceramide glucosyltransferase
MDTSTLLTGLRIILLVLVACSMAYCLYALGCVVLFFRPAGSRKKDEKMEQEFPPVSVLKPVKGLEAGSKGNLLSFCTQDYPCYEVLFGFGEEEDEALPLVRDIIASAICDSRITLAKRNAWGTNRKVLNLQALGDEARYPLLAISDSDMYVGADYLRTIVTEYNACSKTGLVTCLYKISAPDSPGSALESLTIGVDFIPSVLVAARMEGVTFGLGASMLISSKALREIGGFEGIADYLADDYQLGFKLWKSGYENILSRYVIEDCVGPMRISDYLRHQLRWARTYRASRPKGFLGYGVTHAFPISLLLVIAHPSRVSALVVLGVVVARYALSLTVYSRVIRKSEWLKWLPLLPVKDMLAFFIWLWSFCGSTVRWRGNRYRVLRGGKMVKI